MLTSTPHPTAPSAPRPFAIDHEEFAGRRVLVTGGTQGTGDAIVRRFAAAGAVTVTSARSAPPGQHPGGLFVPADLCTSEGVDALVQAVEREIGGVDVLIHNLGGSSAPGGGFAALTDALWQSELALNLMAAVRLDRALVPAMVAQRRGVVIHVSSIQRRLPLHESITAYAAAKAALSAYSKALSKELGPHGVRVNSIAPGWILTSAADAMVKRLAASTGSDEATARLSIMETSVRAAAIRSSPGDEQISWKPEKAEWGDGAPNDGNALALDDSAWQQRRAFDLGKQSRHGECRDADSRPCRVTLLICDVTVSHDDEELQVPHINVVAHHLHDIVKRGASRRQHLLHVLERLNELGLLPFNHS
jgi:NAD(P)-dependent dehydrogenase (short-subunit alcohol dehydrogenase family)